MFAAPLCRSLIDYSRPARTVSILLLRTRVSWVRKRMVPRRNPCKRTFVGNVTTTPLIAVSHVEWVRFVISWKHYSHTILLAINQSTAYSVCNFNRHYAEFAGYWTTTEFLSFCKEAAAAGELPIKFYDSVTGELLFTAPVNRTLEDFLKESQKHGWPSFRDDEVNWEYVRCLRDGECVSTTGTHLGHNIPDGTGNRYCINLVSVAGQPEK